jgi:hypothetical protein
VIFDELTVANSSAVSVDSDVTTVAERDRKIRFKHRVSKMYTEVRFTGSWVTQDYNVVKLGVFFPFVSEF